MTTISNEFMQRMISKTKNYTLVILKATLKRNEPGSDKIVWEHGRKNFVLRAEGLLSIVCPVSDNCDVSGIGIFNAGIEETKKIMDEDPAVKAGIFNYEIYPCRSFPGDSLPV
jgi:hypothetical protein